MASDDKYEYLDEDSIDDLLKCKVCYKPFINPMTLPCKHTVCKQCIESWLQQTKSCPVCRKAPLQQDQLKSVTESILIQMLDRLKVKCNECGQTDLERGNFSDHLAKTCIKSIIDCPAADIRCTWKGQRDQLDSHLATCNFERIRPVLSELIAENRQLKEKIKQLQMNNQIQQTTVASAMNTTGSVNRCLYSRHTCFAKPMKLNFVGNLHSVHP